jgi:hypothetical protein
MSETDSNTTLSKPKSDLGEEIERFTVALDGLETTLPLVLLTAIGAHRYTSQKLEGFLASKAELIPEGGTKKKYRVPLNHVFEVSRLHKEIEKIGVGLDIIPRSFLVSLVSQFDIFLGRLLHWLYETRPELLNTSQKTSPFPNLSGLARSR